MYSKVMYFKIVWLLQYYNNVHFKGAGGPAVPPLDPVDLKVEELLGEKNETVGRVVPLDLNLHLLK